jgi:hypothetical protein
VNSDFGRTTSDAGVRLLARPHRPAALRIMCVNPAAPAGGAAWLTPYLPALALQFLPGRAPSVTTPWVSYPHAYLARCESSGNATWLQVTSRDPRAHRALTALAEPILGLHVLDVNIALGDLVTLVADEASAYRRRG